MYVASQLEGADRLDFEVIWRCLRNSNFAVEHSHRDELSKGRRERPQESAANGSANKERIFLGVHGTRQSHSHVAGAGRRAYMRSLDLVGSMSRSGPNLHCAIQVARGRYAFEHVAPLHVCLSRPVFR